MHTIQEKILCFGHGSKSQAENYLAKQTSLSAEEYIQSDDKADAVVFLKKVDFEVLEAVIARGDKVVLDACPRLTESQTQTIRQKADAFSRCFYAESFLYTRLFDSLSGIFQKEEYGKLLSVKMSMRFDGLHDMDLRRKIHADLCALFTLLGWKLQKMHAVGARRAVPTGKAQLVFLSGVNAEYEYERGANNRSVWRFFFEEAELKVFPFSGRVVVLPKEGKEQIKKFALTPLKGGLEKDMKKLLKGEKTRLIPLPDFIDLRKVSLKLR